MHAASAIETANILHFNNKLVYPNFLVTFFLNPDAVILHWADDVKFNSVVTMTITWNKQGKNFKSHFKCYLLIATV